MGLQFPQPLLRTFYYSMAILIAVARMDATSAQRVFFLLAVRKKKAAGYFVVFQRKRIEQKTAE